PGRAKPPVHAEHAGGAGTGAKASVATAAGQGVAAARHQPRAANGLDAQVRGAERKAAGRQGELAVDQRRDGSRLAQRYGELDERAAEGAGVQGPVVLAAEVQRRSRTQGARAHDRDVGLSRAQLRRWLSQRGTDAQAQHAGLAARPERDGPAMAAGADRVAVVEIEPAGVARLGERV